MISRFSPTVDLLPAFLSIISPSFKIELNNFVFAVTSVAAPAGEICIDTPDIDPEIIRNLIDPAHHNRQLILVVGNNGIVLFYPAAFIHF
jgi:hypothetical protein